MTIDNTKVLTATYKQLSAVIGANALAGIGTLIFGQPGVGKTTIIKAVGDALKSKFTGGVFIFSTVEYNAIDFAGLYRVTDEGFTERCPYNLIPMDKPILILIDEFGDCDRFEQSQWYRLALEKTLGDKPLAPGSVVCAATNRPEDNAAANEVSSAFKGRMCCVTVDADFEPLLDYGWANGWDTKILAFLRAFGSEAINNGFDPDSPYAGCTPRDWERINTLEKQGLISPDASIARLQIVGNVDHTFGEKYAAFRGLDIPDPKLVLDSPATAPIPDKIEKQFLYASAVIGAAEPTDSHFASVLEYCFRCDRVMGYGLFWDLTKRHRKFQSTTHFAKGAIEYQDLPV